MKRKMGLRTGRVNGQWVLALVVGLAVAVAAQGQAGGQHADHAGQDPSGQKAGRRRPTWN